MIRNFEVPLLERKVLQLTARERQLRREVLTGDLAAIQALSALRMEASQLTKKYGALQGFKDDEPLNQYLSATITTLRRLASFKPQNYSIQQTLKTVPWKKGLAPRSPSPFASSQSKISSSRNSRLSKSPSGSSTSLLKSTSQFSSKENSRMSNKLSVGQNSTHKKVQKKNGPPTLPRKIDKTGDNSARDQKKVRPQPVPLSGVVTLRLSAQELQEILALRSKLAC